MKQINFQTYEISGHHQMLAHTIILFFSTKRLKEGFQTLKYFVPIYNPPPPQPL